MNHMSLDELIEFLTDMREKGQAGDTPVATRASYGFNRVRSDRINTRRVTKTSIDRNATSLEEAANRGVQVIVIG